MSSKTKKGPDLKVVNTPDLETPSRPKGRATQSPPATPPASTTPVEAVEAPAPAPAAPAGTLAPTAKTDAEAAPKAAPEAPTAEESPPEVDLISPESLQLGDLDGALQLVEGHGAAETLVRRYHTALGEVLEGSTELFEQLSKLAGAVVNLGLDPDELLASMEAEGSDDDSEGEGAEDSEGEEEEEYEEVECPMCHGEWPRELRMFSPECPNCDGAGRVLVRVEPAK